MAKKKKVERAPTPPETRKRIWLLALGFFLVAIVVLPGAASPFRTPKAVLALVSILVIAGSSIAGQLARGRLHIRWSPIATILVTLPILQALSGFWSASPRLALTAALNSSIWIVGALWIATVSDRERSRLTDLAVIGAGISGVVLVAQAAGLAVFSLGPPGPSGRLALTGLTGNPADLAMSVVLMLPLVLSAPQVSKNPWFRWTLSVLLTAAAVISQTLTAFVALGLIWGVWLIHQRSKRLWLTAAVTTVALIGVGLTTGLDTRIKRQLKRLERGDWYFLLSARSDGWTAAGEMIRNRPATGIGASGFSHAYYPSRVAWLQRAATTGHRSELATHFRFAHCDPLQMIAELGFPGLVWMVAFAVVGVRFRPRGDPLPLLAAAAFVPFALLHFPTHLAVGLVPLVLILGHVLANGREVAVEPGPWIGRTMALVCVILVLAGSYWQLQRLMLNLWRGGLSHALNTAQTLEEPLRSQQAAAVEAQIVPRITGLAAARPWLWRMVGQARIIRGEYQGGESAYRNAMALWPHEEAEFGLGLALAGQDRRAKEEGLGLDARNLRGEAIVHLARVCRTNPALLGLIDDVSLRRSVAEIVEAGKSGR